MSIFRRRESRQGPGSDLSMRLATCETTEERREVFVDGLDLEGDAKELNRDCKKVAKLLNNNDREGLIEHGSRHIGEQAVARAEVIRSQFPLDS